MKLFRPFEQDIIRIMASSALGGALVERILTEATFVSYTYSGCGYFLTATHPDLPETRQVVTEPLVIGTVGDIVAAYLIFLENKELILEGYTAGANEVPAQFRDNHVQITVT